MYMRLSLVELCRTPVPLKLCSLPRVAVPELGCLVPLTSLKFFACGLSSVSGTAKVYISIFQEQHELLEAQMFPSSCHLSVAHNHARELLHMYWTDGNAVSQQTTSVLPPRGEMVTG